MDKDFMQISKQLPKLITNLLRHYPTALDVFLHLVACSNNYGACVVSQGEIKKAIGVKSRRTVYRAIKFLSNHHYLFVGHIGKQNAYITNPKLVWKASTKEESNITNRLKFPAAVVLTKEENEKIFREYKRFSKACNRHVDLDKVNPPKHGRHATKAEKADDIRSTILPSTQKSRQHSN